MPEEDSNTGSRSSTDSSLTSLKAVQLWGGRIAWHVVRLKGMVVKLTAWSLGDKT